MIKYKGYIIEHEFGLGGDRYYIYEPKNWHRINMFQNHPLCDVKKYIDEQLEEQIKLEKEKLRYRKND